MKPHMRSFSFGEKAKGKRIKENVALKFPSLEHSRQAKESE